MFDYDKLSKEDLVEIMEATLANEDLAGVVNNAMEKSRKYGLVWRDHSEDVATRCEKEFPYVKEVKSRHITTLDVFKREDVFDWVERSDNKIKYNTPHILIEGDNYHSLSVLNFTHKNKIDIIYIDPPYNTGNEGWIYNDRIIDKEDGYSHSKWLSFMEKRLRLAKPLLKDSGVIFVSIDDNEFAQTKLLLDDIFGEHNFISNITVRKTGQQQNTGKNIASVTEYILVYAKNLYDSNGKKRDLFTREAIENRKGIDAYNKSDDQGIYTTLPLKHSTNGTHAFSVIAPNGEEVSSTCWLVTREKFEGLEKVDMLYWSSNNFPRYKKYLESHTGVLRNSYIDGFYNEKAKIDLNKMFGYPVFDFPKSVDLIKHIIEHMPNKKSIVLDFFAGTGTTGHAVLELNNEDGGDRQFILCTNDENEICTSVCHPRLSKVIHGYTKPNSEKVKGIPANLRYYKCDDNCFVTVSGSMDTMKAGFNRDAGTPMVCIAEGVYDQIDMETENAEVIYRIFNHGDNYLGIFYDTINEEGMTRFANKLRSYEGKKIVYVFTYDDVITEEILEDDYHELNEIEGLEVKALPVDIINTYKRIFRK